MPASLHLMLKTAGEPTRLRLLGLLLRDAACVCDLQAVLKMPQPTVSRHLAALRAAGLVTCVRRGNRVLYSLARARNPQAGIIKTVLERGSETDPRLRADAARRRSLTSARGGNNRKGRTT